MLQPITSLELSRGLLAPKLRAGGGNLEDDVSGSTVAMRFFGEDQVL